MVMVGRRLVGGRGSHRGDCTMAKEKGIKRSERWRV